MGGFFNIDGPFSKFGNMLADIMILGFLWTVCSIPIFTIGASSTALYYVMLRRISDKEGYIFSDFLKSFKRDFKASTAIWLILLALSILLYINIKNIGLLGDLKLIILPVQIGFAIELLITSMYIFPIISRFEMKFTQYFKSAFFMANRHILNTLLCLAIAIAIFLVCCRFAALFLISVGIYSFATSFFFMRIFRKYRPEMDGGEIEELL